MPSGFLHLGYVKIKEEFYMTSIYVIRISLIY